MSIVDTVVDCRVLVERNRNPLDGTVSLSVREADALIFNLTDLNKKMIEVESRIMALDALVKRLGL